MWKRGEIAPKEQFLLFSTLLYIYIFLTSGIKLHIHLLNSVVQFIVFLTLSTLICQGTDISKCFSEFIGMRDNESRLYLSMLDKLEDSGKSIYLRRPINTFAVTLQKYMTLNLGKGPLCQLSTAKAHASLRFCAV